MSKSKSKSSPKDDPAAALEKTSRDVVDAIVSAETARLLVGIISGSPVLGAAAAAAVGLNTSGMIKNLRSSERTSDTSAANSDISSKSLDIGELDPALIKGLNLEHYISRKEFLDLLEIMRDSGSNLSNIYEELGPDEKIFVDFHYPDLIPPNRKTAPVDPDPDSPSPTPEAKLLAPAIDAALEEIGVAGIDAAELAQLVAANLAHRGIGIAQRESQAGLPPVALPTEAPETYQGLRGPETPPDFVKRVYSEWLGQGLTRAHIRTLDPKLYTAIDNWSRRNEWPADVDLPKLKELNDRWVDRVQKEGLAPVLTKTDPAFALREADRLRGAMQRRKEK